MIWRQGEHDEKQRIAGRDTNRLSECGIDIDPAFVLPTIDRILSAYDTESFSAVSTSWCLGLESVGFRKGWVSQS